MATSGWSGQSVEEVSNPRTVRDLSNVIADLHRKMPVIVCAPGLDGRPAVDVDNLMAAIAAHPRMRTRLVVLTTDHAHQTFNDALHNRGLPDVRTATVRVFAPHGGTLRTEDRDHPYVRADRTDPGARIGLILDAIVQVDPSVGPRPAVPTAPTKRPIVVPLPGPARSTAVAAQAATPAATTTPASSPVPEVSTGKAAATTPSLVEPTPATAAPIPAPEPERRVEVVRVHQAWPEGSRALVDLSETLVEQARQLAHLRGQVETLTSDLKAETVLTYQLRRENDRLREQAGRNRGGSGSPSTPPASDVDRTPVYADPERQLRHEIELTWLETVGEGEREQWPLREYAVGADFIASLDTVNVSRRKATEVAVQILTRRAVEVPAREVRQFGETAGPGCPQLSRTDGAMAWRANLSQNTAQAARFLWWEMPDGTVELGKAALHDDTDLR